MNFVTYVHNLFKRYYYEKRNKKDVTLLRSGIGSLFLTGEEIMESGITDFSEIYEKANEDVEELKDKIEMRKRVYQTLKESYQELKSTQQEENRTLKESYQELKPTQEENRDDYNTLKEKIAKIERIIQGKQGIILDEIKEAIR